MKPAEHTEVGVQKHLFGYVGFAYTSILKMEIENRNSIRINFGTEIA
jgi:hypothetical protein